MSQQISSQGQNKAPAPPAGAAPGVSYTPTDLNIPPELYDKIPNLELYQQLKKQEREIDLLISRKALDFQAIQQKSFHPSNVATETGLLRVFIYNTCEDQPWQGNKGDGEPTWTLRVEGRFIADSNATTIPPESVKFSSFLSAISIDLVPNEHYPQWTNAQQNIIEWREDPRDKTAGFDGIDVRRQGTYDLRCKVALLPKSHSPSPRFRLSPQLAQFIGKEEATQQELMYTIWQYVIYKGLFLNTEALTKVPVVSSDIVPDEDEDALAVIRCDPVLKLLLNVDQFKFSELYKLLQPHCRPRAPMIIEYTINTRKSSTMGEVVVDIPIELPLNMSKYQKEALEFNKQAFENLTKADTAISQLNQKISLAIVSLQNANAREQFYRELAEDPAKFVDQWLKTQSETLKALKSDEGYDEELVRRAQFFEDNEALIRDKISLLLGTNRFT
ncbi:transcription regulatory protein Snf12p [Diutina catenulata]